MGMSAFIEDFLRDEFFFSCEDIGEELRTKTSSVK